MEARALVAASVRLSFAAISEGVAIEAASSRNRSSSWAVHSLPLFSALVVISSPPRRYKGSYCLGASHARVLFGNPPIQDGKLGRLQANSYERSLSGRWAPPRFFDNIYWLCHDLTWIICYQKASRGEVD
jgi:hypothetical protein